MGSSSSPRAAAQRTPVRLDLGPFAAVALLAPQLKANVSKRERAYGNAIQAGRVSYQLLRLPGSVEVPPVVDSVPAIEAPETPPALQA